MRKFCERFIRLQPPPRFQGSDATWGTKAGGVSRTDSISFIRQTAATNGKGAAVFKRPAFRAYISPEVEILPGSRERRKKTTLSINP